MSRRNAGEDWAFRKRLSPRLHNNAEVHNANPLVDGRRFSSRLCKSCSNIVDVPSRKSRSPATFSPKFHNPVAASSPEHGVNGTCSPKLGESLTQTHSPPAANPNFQRRLSPRLHKHLACRNSSVPTGSNRDSSSMRRRLSPRLHQDQPPQVEGREDRPNHSALQRRLTSIIDNNAQNKKRTPKHSALQRRVSPRLHQKQTSKDSSPPRRVRPRLYNNAESEKQTPEESAPRRRVSPRLHCDAASEKQTPKESAPRRRVSPRLGMDAESAKQTPKESVPHPRVGPRLHIDAESEKQTPKVSAPHRRVSARLHGNREKHLRQESALRRRVSPKFHGVGKIENQIPVSNGVANGKRSCSGSHTNSSFGNAKRSKHDWNSKPSQLNGSAPAASNGQPGQSNMGFKVLAKKPKMESLAPVIARGSIRARVKETLRIFNTYYLQFVQEEEERCRKSEVKRGKKREASKFKEKDAKQTSSRPDLKAVSKMKEKKEILYPDKIIGHVPGIEVGYQFFSRAEMVAIGFHSHWLNGIDYIGQSTTKMEGQRCYNFPIAVAIVMSGQYEDDLDNLEDIIYTGQGGHDLVGSKLQCADQVLLRGNLAMKNSMEQSIPVRVIRGHRNAKSYTGKLYTYDGLYKVVETWADKGQRGHLVYKYHLKRMQEQPQLTTNQVQFVRGCPSKAFSELPGLVCCDISNGQEPICIPVTNIHDDVTVDEGFTYIKTLEVSKSVTLPPTAAGCACKGNCTNPKTCACARLNGSDFPYVRRDGGRLVEPKDVVFECGANCNCGPRCLNRTSQRGMKYHLEVYRTPDKGWAVRSWDFIPSGAPVCEYIGLLRRSDEVDHISGNEYIFEIDCWHTMNEIEGRERRFGNLPVSATKALQMIDEKTLDSTPEFCIDAGSRGNVARFMNHSCEPNLFVQCILSTCHDVRFARVVFFAAENIPPLQELTYDYGFALDSVVGPDGEVKALPCVCGTADCRKRLY